MEIMKNCSACSAVDQVTYSIFHNDTITPLPSNIGVPELEIPLYIYIVSSFANGLIFLTGTFGNILVIAVVLKVKNMRTPTNVFLLNLSVADVLVLIVCQPAGLLEFFGKDKWFLGGFMCKLVPFLENGVLHVSILTMIAVTYERYNALCHPLKYRMSSTILGTVKVIISIWISGILLTLPFIVMTVHEDAQFYDGSPIKVCRTKVNEVWGYTYIIFVFIAFFALPFGILIVLYSQIIRKLTSEKLQCLVQSDRSALRTIQSRKQVVRMLIFIIVLFFVSLFPIRVTSLWLIFTSPQNVTNIGLEGFLNLIMWIRIFMYINSAGNPIIYSLTSTKFKVAFKTVLCRKSMMNSKSLVSTHWSQNRRPNYRFDHFLSIQMSHFNNTKVTSDKMQYSINTSSRSNENDSM